MWLSKVETVFQYGFEAIHPLHHSGVVCGVGARQVQYKHQRADVPDAPEVPDGLQPIRGWSAGRAPPSTCKGRLANKKLSRSALNIKE